MATKSDFHVLIIGAGSVGLLIAQRLQTLGIKCTVFERERFLNERPRDWTFGIYWAQDWLRECLPASLLGRLNEAQVDRGRRPGAEDYMRMVNGSNGEDLTVVRAPGVVRLRRSRFRGFLVGGEGEGVDVKYGKRLGSISEHISDGVTTVMATFEDGSKATGNLLVGADGAKSVVRTYLLGPDVAALHPLPIMGLHATYTFPPDVAAKVATELRGQTALLSYHPVRCGVWFAPIIIPDAERPESWTWSPTITFRHEIGDESLNSPEEFRRAWTRFAEVHAEPFRSALLALPLDAELRCERLAQWPTVEWGRSGSGAVTLAGDAAHPMTYHRGQGLNNAVHDACTLCRAIDAHVSDGKPLVDVMKAYEEEVVERGREAVISSGQNSLMLMDWEQLMKAEIFKRGVAGHAKKES